MSFAPGETVVLHEVWRERVWSARPLTLVRDEEDLVALWFPEGTSFKRAVPPPTRTAPDARGERLGSCLALGDWVFEDAVWDVSTLVLMRPGEWHAIWCSWRAGEHLPWYVNLQEPFRRTSCGFETMDLALDVVVHGDGRWYWKDEDELATFVELGVFDAALAARLRDEGLAAVRRAERNEPPLDEPWSKWRPDPTWPRPELPADWDEPCL